jgi:hypothetical protein
MSKFTSLEQMIPALRSLRDRADDARVGFIRACMQVEESTLWRDCESAKSVDFADWLERYAHLCGAESYRRESAAMRDAKIAAVIPQIGIAAAAIAFECPKEHRQKLVEGLVGFAQDHPKTASKGNPSVLGCVPSATARRMREALVGGKSRESTLDRTEEQLKRLTEENRTLKAEVAALRRENRTLKTKLDKCQAKQRGAAEARA